MTPCTSTFQTFCVLSNLFANAKEESDRFPGRGDVGSGRNFQNARSVLECVQGGSVQAVAPPDELRNWQLQPVWVQLLVLEGGKDTPPGTGHSADLVATPTSASDGFIGMSLIITDY